MNDLMDIKRFEEIAKRKKKNIISRIPWGYKIIAGVVFAVVIVAIVISIAIPKKKYIQYSVAEEAAANALIWLNQINDNELDFSTVYECMGEMSVTVERKTGRKGAYTQTLLEDTYEACLVQANEGFRKAYVKAIENRILSEDSDAEFDEDTIDNLMNEVYGVSVDEYLESLECEILPSLEDARTRYNQEVTDEK